MSRPEIFLFGFRGFPGVQGGVETHAEHLTPRLVELGFAVTACARSPYLDPRAERRWKGVSLLRTWTVRRTAAETVLHSFVCALVAGLRRPQVVHVQGIGPALVTPLLRLFGLRVVVTHHGEDYNREKWGWLARTALRLGEACGMRFAHRRIVISRSIDNLVAAKYHKSCAVIPNGVVLPELPRDSDLVTELGLEPGKYVLSVGRLVPEKRHLDLLRAFQAADLPGWKLALVGSVDHASSYADHLVLEARRDPRVVVAGFRSGEALRQLYGHAGVFALPSSHEGLPIALLEAMSYGVPALVSDIPANLEVVDDPARIFRVGDVPGLSAKLTALARAGCPDPALREAMRRADVGRYDWDNVARMTAAIYGELLGPGSEAVLRPAVPGYGPLPEIASTRISTSTGG
ncbi:glycosyltransferase family 4 protein [uncultured Methylobacterium sp.]|jgi:glycosyltransferase involved in cell wall biosynthesis|uniref:glycosyltransferase family 4 protein n=1 Tax=uncultured Methylobacterium sp. TaxID=157278 RepID=UPI0026124996|nr:glycosyltransferase family 4 protein [uncultured Methylobacterium sp.]